MSNSKKFAIKGNITVTYDRTIRMSLHTKIADIAGLVERIFGKFAIFISLCNTYRSDGNVYEFIYLDSPCSKHIYQSNKYKCITITRML